MPKKKGTKKKGCRGGTEPPTKRLLEFKEDMQDYAKITKLLGDCRIMVVLPDQTDIMAIIPGRFRKRVRMIKGDVILIERREFQIDKCDVIHKYNDEEIRQLVKLGEIPEFFLHTEATSDGCIIIGDSESEEDEQPPEIDFDNI